ncbi:MAG: acyl carrier protein [Alphaproteobacteria bacterium]|nr:acyl carrier protein [Alphaproteobacteria bacterium]
MSDKLIDLFASILDIDPAGLNDESSPDTVEQWDSLAAMHLVAAIEEEFDIRLSTKEIMKMSSIGLARATLKDKGIEL